MPTAAPKLRGDGAPLQHKKKMANPVSVLLIHENDAEAETIARELGASGMEITRVPAVTRETLVAALAATKPDVVLSDHSPERFSACEVMDVVRYERPEIAVIVVAETVTGLAAVSCLRAGVEDIVLRKNIKRLPEAIVRAMSGGGPWRNREPSS